MERSLQLLLGVQQAVAEAAAAPEASASVASLGALLHTLNTQQEAWGQWWGEAERLGLPTVERLTSCCKEACCMRLLESSPAAIIEVSVEARRLKKLYENRPSHAFKSSVRQLRRFRRTGALRGDASTKSNAANRQRLTRRELTNEMLQRDKDGYFMRTRRGWRKAYLAAQLPNLRKAGCCVNGCAALLHTSKKLLYSLKGGLFQQLGLLTHRPHGSRRGLPTFDELPSKECCQRGCLSLMCQRPGYTAQQHVRYKGADTESKRLDVVLSFLWDPAVGRIMPWCNTSLYLAYGISGYRCDAARGFLADEESALAYTREGTARRAHGNEGREPWNIWPEEKRRKCLEHFDIYTTGRPEDHGLRPAESRITGIPSFMRHFLSKNPEFVGRVKKTAYRSHIMKYLKKHGKTLFSWGSDHNIGSESLAINDRWRWRSMLWKKASHTLNAAIADHASEDKLAELRRIAQEREDDLREAAAALDAHVKPDTDIRGCMGIMLDTVVAQERRVRDYLCQVTCMNTVVDDKSAIELYHMAMQRQDFEAFYNQFNGQVNLLNNRLSAYITPPYASPKNGSVICWELFLDGVQWLRTSDRVRITNFDGGPLNKCQEVSVHFQQFLVDSGLVDCSLVQFFWKYKGKSAADVWFGAVQTLLKVAAVVVGPHDLARLVESMSWGMAEAMKNKGMVLEPTAFPTWKAYFLGMYNDLANLTCTDFHFVCCSGDLSNIPDVPLGLPGWAAGMGLRSLLEHFASPKAGWAGFRRLPDTVKVELPVWNVSPTYVPMETAQQDNYTVGTLEKLGPLCELAFSRDGVKSQLDAMGKLNGVDRQYVTFPGGYDYMKTGGMQADGTHLTRPRNRIADSLPTTAGFHKPEAAVNAIDGRPTAFVPAEDDDDESITPRLPTQVEGETGQAFPLDKVGEKCYAGVKQYVDDNLDINVHAEGHEFIEAVVLAVSGKTLETLIHDKITDRDQIKAIKSALRNLRRGELAGVAIKKPPEPKNFKALYIEARTDQILLADPSQARGAARKTATTEWKAKGKDPRSRELVAARDHPDLQARAEQLATA